MSDTVDALDPDDRIPIPTAHELLAAAVELTGDEHAGLRAAMRIEVGDFSALEYAASTANTAGDALETIARYMHLINDALTVEISVRGDRAVISLESAVLLPQAAEAYQVGAFFAAFKHRASKLADGLGFEIWFTHRQPEDVSPYVELFSECATLRFDQPQCGWALPAEILAAPLSAADPHLHELVRNHAELLLQDLPRADSFTARVRELVTEQLPGGHAGIAETAAALHVSQRTLARRLDEEGTSFKELIEEVRRRLAQRYVGQTDLALSEIAFLLGFSQTSAFHRAFKRWTDQTPRDYRSAHRG